MQFTVVQPCSYIEVPVLMQEVYASCLEEMNKDETTLITGV